MAEPLEHLEARHRGRAPPSVDECSRPSASIPSVRGRARPHEFSGGQCQRISIARALVLDPKLIICDEPVSALDVSVQAQILNLLEDMKARYGLTLVFIAHDLAVVKNISDRVAVMYLGKLCEVGAARRALRRPGPPVHRGAARSIPVPDPTVAVTRARRRSAASCRRRVDPPSGCRFRTRCPRPQDAAPPRSRRIAPGRARPLRRLPLPAGDPVEDVCVEACRRPGPTG